MLSITTDYVADIGCPERYLRRIADAGFTHLHWCHHWSTDFLYLDCEVARIAAWMREYSLGLTDLHGSRGKEKNWASPLESERLAGVELAKNRINMTARLGGGSVVMHVPAATGDPEQAECAWDQWRKSLDELEPYARIHGVRIAIENGDFDRVEEVLAMYDPGFLGLCYDSGHGNMIPDGLDRLDRLKHRLIAVHISDSDDEDDPHKLVFSGTLDWPRFARILAESAYDKWVSMEILKGRSDIEDEDEFLREAFRTGSRLAEMIAQHRPTRAGHSYSK